MSYRDGLKFSHSQPRALAQTEENDMSHLISQTDGIAHMADSQMDSQGRVNAWHKLGTPVGHTMTATEALEAANLAKWDVRKRPLWADLREDGVEDQRGIVVPDQYATVFTNPVNKKITPIGVVGGKYTPIQNESMSDIAEAIVDESGAHYETAGSLRNYSQTFLTMKLPRTMVLTGLDGREDISEWYLSIFNSHNGSASLMATINNIRVVCANTQDVNIAGAKSIFKIQHSKNWADKVKVAREALGLFFVYEEAFENAVRALFEQPMTNGEMKAFAEDLTDLSKAAPNTAQATRRQNEANMITKLFVDSPTIAGTAIAGTRFAAYNAVTEYVDHIAGVRGAGDDVDAQGALRATRTLSLVASGAPSLKTAAWNILSN
jgi:phage/plasmid-like protein (TIGR03299 family)